MRQLRLSFVGLVVSMVGLFAIGRVNFAAFDAVSTPVSVHLVTAALVVALIATRLLSRVPASALIVGVSAAYVFSRAFVDKSEATHLVAGAALTAIEVALAAASVLLAVRVARGLRQFEESVANITLDELPGVLSLEQARDDIAIEMSRARRHERPLTVTVVSFDPNSVHATLHEIVRDVQRRMMQRYIMSGLARAAAQTTRRGDIVVQDPAANRVIVLSPESTPGQLDALTHRLQESAYRSLGIPLRFGTAGFPDSALTFDDLVASASGAAAIDVEAGHADSARLDRLERQPARSAIRPMLTRCREVGEPAPVAGLGEAVHAVNGD